MNRFLKELEVLIEFCTGMSVDDVMKPPATFTEWNMKYPNSPLRRIPFCDLTSMTYEQLEEKYPELLSPK